MQKLLQLKIQPFLPNPYGNARKPSSSFSYTPLSNRAQIRKPITCAKSNNRRLSGSTKSTRSVLQLVNFVASNFNIVPEPWNSLIRKFGGGNPGGPGSGSGKGFGWGGFDGWGWRRRGRGRKGKSGFWGFLMAFGLGLWLILGKELEWDVFIGGFEFIFSVGYCKWMEQTGFRMDVRVLLRRSFGRFSAKKREFAKMGEGVWAYGDRKKKQT